MNTRFLSVGGQKARLLLLTSVVWTMTCVVGQAVIFNLDTTNAIDTFADSRNPMSNFGGEATINVGHADGTTSVQMWGFLQFDMTTMPELASSATLSLFRSGGSGTLGTPVEVYVVTSSWSEDTLTYANLPTMESTAFTSTVVNATGSYYSFDITSVYNQWKAGTLSNFGVVFKSNTANGEGFDFRSTEFPSSSVRPTVDVTAVPEPGTWGLLALGGAVVLAGLRRKR